MSEGVFYRPPAAGVYDSSAGGLGTSPTWLSPMEGGKGEPPGVIHMYCGATAPGGYLICDGSEVDRKTYKRLFTLFGTAFGIGDNSTTFNLPDLRGRIPVGVGPNADVGAVGANDGLAPASRSPKHNHVLPSHTHSLTDPGHTTDMYVALTGGNNTGTYQRISPSAQLGPATGGDPGTDDSRFKFGINQQTGISIGDKTSSPPVGPGGSRPTDTPAFLAINYIVKT